MTIAPGPAKVPRVIRVRFQLKPSDAFAAVIGTEQVARPHVIKKLWDYCKAQNLQDPANKRSINAGAKLLTVFDKPPSQP